MPPELRDQEPRRRAVPSASVPVIDVPTAEAPWLTPTASPTGGFAETVLVACAGDPPASEVVALLRAAGGPVPAAGTARVTAGPFCAGTWQISLVTIPEAEPMFVVTGDAAAGGLRLITAGTNVCSSRVRATAPSAVRAVACDEAPLPSASPAVSATPSARPRS